MIKKYYGCYLPTKNDIPFMGQKRVYKMKERNGRIASVRLALHILYAEELIEMKRDKKGNEIYFTEKGEKLVKLYYPDNYVHDLNFRE